MLLGSYREPDQSKEQTKAVNETVAVCIGSIAPD